MKKLLLAAIAALALTSCQKDYYLEDLNEANEKIERLKQENIELAEDLVAELNRVLEENHQYSNEIRDLKSRLNSALSDLQSANADISLLQSEIEALEEEINEILFDPTVVGEMDGFTVNSLSDWNNIEFPKNNTFVVKGDINWSLNSNIISTEVNPIFNRIVRVTGCVNMQVPTGWFDFEKLESIGCGIDLGDGIKAKFYTWRVEDQISYDDEIPSSKVQVSNRIYIDASSAQNVYGSKFVRTKIFMPSYITEYNIQVRYGTSGTSCYNVCGHGDDSFSESEWNVSEININDNNDDRKLVYLDYKINGITKRAKIIQVDF